MRLLITGGSGFIMTNLFQYLLTLDDQPEVRLFDLNYGQNLCNWEDVAKKMLEETVKWYIDNDFAVPYRRGENEGDNLSRG